MKWLRSNLFDENDLTEDITVKDLIMPFSIYRKFKISLAFTIILCTGHKFLMEIMHNNHSLGAYYFF